METAEYLTMLGPRRRPHGWLDRRRAWAASLANVQTVLAGLILFLCAWAVNPAWSAEAGANTLERSVKAAFLYKFASYAEWPEASFPRSNTPLTIGVLGADDIAVELPSIVAGRRIDDRPILVRQLKEGESLAGVHALFIGGTDRARIGAAIRMAQPRPILVITESEDALTLGSAINLVLSDGRVRFEVAPDAAERRGIKLSSRLLSVAQNIRPGRP